MLDILATGRQRGPQARNDIIQRVNEAGVPLPNRERTPGMFAPPLLSPEVRPPVIPLSP